MFIKKDKRVLYFYENAPEYAIVVAGSLLGLAINEVVSNFIENKIGWKIYHCGLFLKYKKNIKLIKKQLIYM